MTEGRERAFAKVNLFLHVVGRRPDGYHLLDSLAVFAEVSDLLHAKERDELSLRVDGPFAPSLADTARADNLVLRAARALAASAGIAPRARLTLTKTLPVASGLGGGSADAAAALRLLARLWGIAPGRAALNVVATGLGADVPVCLGSRPARMGGVGEILAPSPALPQCGLALLNPGVPVATADVFRHRVGGFSEPVALMDGWADAAAMATGLAALRNDLEPAAVALCPSIGVALGALRRAPGCLLARMSGSGGTCFGLFATPDEARAAQALARLDWWSWGG
ncbi:MAG: 4-(cytidine 5'-diphospho)-2-C-methyl-D-erythritol kinase, partial [Acetobacteraceae bacterium]|nr:4-(cytidine 5'-diphospho)-2-C-methyl-D-erythritol kinase [Acetobacteraceae bacterium]